MFLLIRGTQPFPDARLSFTFQYVSINTNKLNGLESGLCDFTFQYVSINTKATDQSAAPGSPLHSNMFLLIQDISDNIDIPRSAFTFQYVSINTRH